MANNGKVIWDFLINQGFSKTSVAGIMGNLQAESNLESTNLQNYHNSKFNMTDAQYTQAVDNGSYTNFVYDQGGYGLAQWTFWSRKKELLEFAKSKGVSIGNLQMQLEFLMKELKRDFSGLYNSLKTINNLSDATSTFMIKFENPDDKSQKAQNNRIAMAQQIYNTYANSIVASAAPAQAETVSVQEPAILKKGMTGAYIQKLQQNLIKLGYPCGQWGADGDFGNDTQAAVLRFQHDFDLEIDGLVGPLTKKAIIDALNGIGPKPTPVVSTTISKKKYNDVMLGYAAKDENSRYSGGMAGDQTGGEVKIAPWYNSGWNIVIRPLDDSVAEKIASTCEAACNNNNIGYDQGQRNTIYSEAKKVGMDLSKIQTPCECDCSSLVSVCCIAAGKDPAPFYAGGNLRCTSNLRAACASVGGFSYLYDSKYTQQKTYLQRGDIVLNEASHVAVCLQDGSGVVREVSPAPVQETKVQTYKGVITANLLNIRNGASMDSKIVGMIHKDKQVQIYEIEGNWGKIDSGWICLDYVKML